MKRTAIVMSVAFVMAIASAFTLRVNDVYVKSANPLAPCVLVACQQAPTAVVCNVNAPVDGKYYKPGCVEQVLAYKPQ